MVDSKKRSADPTASIVTFLMSVQRMGVFQKDGVLTSSLNVDFPQRRALSVCRLERRVYSGLYGAAEPHYLDASLLVFVEITLNRGAPDVFEQFNTAVQKLEEIQECHLVSGDFDYLLETRVDMSAYRKLLGKTLAASAHVTTRT